MEDCVLFKINKAVSSTIINEGLQSEYEDRIDFMKSLDIFADIDMFILLPLVSNLKVKKFKLGEYLVKAGNQPQGLIMIKKGVCMVAA
jgi:hypothetical protein